VIWGVAYVVLLLVLFVRVQTDPDAAQRGPIHPVPGDPLPLIQMHHRLFAAILVGAPLEALLRGGPSRWRLVGLLAFAAGVALYRFGGRALGDSLSPLSEPRPGATLVTAGPYRWIRHPMYLGQALIAVGAPLTLGCRFVPWLAVPAIFILGRRMALEDAALARTYPEYPHYAAHAKRIIPFVY
jgi:protein-S-isoprenylcysteine O-methyltransferase Ste14